MSVAVVFPWRPQPGREAPYRFVRSWWEGLLPEARFCEVDTDHQPFNLAACRNAAIEMAGNEETVVICDADTIIDPAVHVLDAIDGAGDGRMHMPFTAQLYLTEDETVDLYRGRLPARQGHVGNGACYIVRPDAYRSAGGSDERFTGWGGDDDQLVAATATLIGLERHAGVALSLWHPAIRDAGSERHRPNSMLARRYWAAMGDPAKIRALIAER